jgi:protein-disulfide isomerase
MAKDKQAARAAADQSSQPPTDGGGGGGGMNTGVAIIGFIFCFLAGIAIMAGWDRKHGVGGGTDITSDKSGASAQWNDEAGYPPISSKDPMLGKRDAAVTIVVFSDFQCPFCSRVEPTLKQVRDTYPNDVRIVWKNYPLPFHQNAKPAGEAGQGVFVLAGNDAFWKFHDTAFGNQQSLDRAHYEQWAQASGVTDMAKFKAGLDAHTWADKLDKDMAVGQQVHVNGTPALFINGTLLSGAQPFDKVKPIIDQELAKAKAKLAAGTAKDQVYVALSNANKAAAPAPADEGEKEDTSTVFKVPVGDSPVEGSPNALVTIVEFSDFQCPFCGRVEPTLKGLRDKYGDKLRIVWKNEPLPMHPRAEPAAEFAMEARAEKHDEGFWKAHDVMFANQQKLGDDDLADYAKQIGVDTDKVKTAITTHKYKASIDADSDLSEDFQASGTPHFFINGRRLVGAQPQEKFEKIIDEEIKKAQDPKYGGKKGQALYDAMIADGKGPPPPEMKTLKDVPPNDPWRGSANAKVVIHEFSDFQCPFCGRVEDTLQQVMKDYGTKIKFIWHDKPLPMHPDAPLASEAGREAFKQKGNDGFWSMHDVLFKNQKEQNGLKREALDGYAKAMGLDMTRWASSLDTSSHQAEIDADSKAGDGMGISGTPAFIIVWGNNPNGYFINGALPYAKFRKMIEMALAQAAH